MALLQWVILEPQGPGSLAAVRFSCLVRVRSLRIFPTGARPFKTREDIVAQTEPSSLYLDVYFNAHPIATDGKNKPKASNVLVPTSIAYQGGQVEFTVNPVNNEFATRLMIVRGKFEKLSLAIYGDIISETTSLPQDYAPKQLPHIMFSGLPPTLDPAGKQNPTELAESLLTLIPAAERPSLPLIVRLMFCLKPSNEDWEEKEFPHLYSALDQGLEDLGLEKAVDMTCRPVSDTEDEEVLREFAARVGDSIVDYNDDQAYFLAKLLSQCAPQHPSLIRLILENVDLMQMYTEPNLDRPTLLYLLDAAASLDVSRQLNNEQTLDAIVHIRDNPTQDDGARRAAARLFNRIKRWEALEDSLVNTQARFSMAALLIKEIGCEENSFGIWLENMLTNHEILDRLQETPPVHGLPHPPLMWEGVQNVSHDEFIAFLRAAIGVAAVVAVYAWADSVPVEMCLERTLAVLRVWQNINGYREIVNHFMLMRQMAYRLECMLPLDDDLPSQAGIDAEHILKSLAMQPMSMLRPDFVKVMQNLQMPLNYITDVEVMELKRAASMAKDGLQGAVRLLTRLPDELDAVQRRYDVRIAVAAILDALQKHSDGEKELLEIAWGVGRSALSACLIRHLVKCGAALRTQFELAVPAHRTHSELASLFRTSYDLLNLLSQLVPSYPPSSRDVSSLTKSVADIFVCTDAADMIYTQESSVCTAAHSARQRCTEVLAALVVPAFLDTETCTASKNVLKTLLSHAAAPEGHDAAHHMTQIFWLFDHVLPFAYAADWNMDPEAGRTNWIRQILPSILPQLRIFYALQETDNKLHLIRRFNNLDKGCIGVADWLLLEEQQMLRSSIASGRASSAGSLDKRVAFWNISNSANILCALVESKAESSKWATTTLLEDENAGLLQSNLRELLSLDAFFEPIGTLAIELSSHVAGTDGQLQTSIVSIILRAIRCGRFHAMTPLLSVLSGTDEPLFDEVAAQNFGETLERIVKAVKSGEDLPLDLAESIFNVLEKVTPMNRSSGAFVFRGLTQEGLKEFTRWLTEAIPVAKKTQLEVMGLRWSVMGEPSPEPDFIPASLTLELSLEKWESLLLPSVPVPSTPKRRSPANSAEMLGMITISPPNALLRSPEVKGLTKTYSNNDFRELRQQSSARQNTSRMPSRHVDDFEQGSSSIAPLNLGVPSSSPPISYPAILPHRPSPLDPSLPMNPMYYQQ